MNAKDKDSYPGSRKFAQDADHELILVSDVVLCRGALALMPVCTSGRLSTCSGVRRGSHRVDVGYDLGV